MTALFYKFTHLVNGKLGVLDIWNLLLLSRRTFTAGEDINIPSDKVLQMNSPIIEGELFVDGEAYIL